ncbi:unnamed protein product [Closterium sp. NIES-54]
MAQLLLARLLDWGNPRDDGSAWWSERHDDDDGAETSSEDLHDDYKEPPELPEDVLIHCFQHLRSYHDIASAARVSRSWRSAAVRLWGHRQRLTFGKCRNPEFALPSIIPMACVVTELDLCGCRLSDASLEAASKATPVCQLQSLSLWGVKGVSDAGICRLVVKCKGLKHLNLGGTCVTSSSIFNIARSCPSLEILNLWGCRKVTDKGVLAVVAGCMQLRELNLWGVPLSFHCLAFLMSRCPDLEIKPTPGVRTGFPAYGIVRQVA